MDIILHPGAHRTASTSFQYYMRHNGASLRAAGTAFWGPADLRKGLLTGAVAIPGPVSPARQLARARGRVALAMEGLCATGMQRLVISDENLIGSSRHNLRNRRLYPAIGDRMARYREALGGRIDRVVFSIRAQEGYWTSAMGYAIPRGAAMPRRGALEQMAHGPRRWRDVITDLACALPGTEIVVLPHEEFASLPERKLRVMTGESDAPRRHAREWLNRAPGADVLCDLLAGRGQDSSPLHRRTGDGRWTPFTIAQRAALGGAYAADLAWLRAGADGLAKLTETPADAGTVNTPAPGRLKRGRTDDIQERRLA